MQKMTNLQNTNSPDQDKIEVRLREKPQSSEMGQKEMKSTLAELKKGNEITKGSLAEYQTGIFKLLQENVRTNH